ncbi:YheE family protein [Lederbergia citrea]|uniref:YheE family protein n=1 Tax=Lederbergia citrea TaxID=2833581 RepID=A0A942Z184_9BACI|nr:YheE family protein [Lederbergia citrea]MBS4177523.1 YheE family protein [Lederbergia citrea]MBS4204197.1 YheE family protein [Lederbergia citrea]MBS4221218.1 YheE family protein [Lederbergia citrea]
MLLHFQVQSLYEDKRLPGWRFSFYFNRCKYEGTYHPDGSIQWMSLAPKEQDQAILEKQIHDLMLYHIYDTQR